ncbi:MAG: hypothetical protein WCK35_15250 [Chloroflexota bacterium]
MLKFNAPLIVVEEMARSRHFYEGLLGQKVKFGRGIEFGANRRRRSDFRRRCVWGIFPSVGFFGNK